MPKLKENQVPAYCLHKASGRAVVTLNDKDIYLGKHGSAERRRSTGASPPSGSPPDADLVDGGSGNDSATVDFHDEVHNVEHISFGHHGGHIAFAQDFFDEGSATV
jgi:hypothetical protein